MEDDMRQLTVEETELASGAACGNLTVSVGLSGVSFSGSVDTWGSCLSGIFDAGSDLYSGLTAHYSTGIPYGEAHVG
jgi:hypothetical protein